MAERIFFLNRVREGVSLDEAERFLRERDIPMGRSIPSITSYTVARVAGWVFDAAGALPYDFVDVLEVTSVADYQRDIKAREGTREWEDFVAEWEHYIGEAVAIHGRVLE